MNYYPALQYLQLHFLCKLIIIYQIEIEYGCIVQSKKRSFFVGGDVC